MTALNQAYAQIVRQRRAARDFLPTPLAPELIRTLLEDAQQAPSNCNTQPWQVHVVSGASREKLSAALLAADDAGRLSSDYYFDMAEYPDLYAGRASASGQIRYDAIGVTRDDTEGRRKAQRENLGFFGAPHVALLFMPALGDSVRVAGDIGMYAQTFLLSLVAHGLAGIPQTMLGLHAGTVREALGIDPQLRLLFGISFGHATPSAPVNAIDVGRVALEDSVTFHR